MSRIKPLETNVSGLSKPEYFDFILFILPIPVINISFDLKGS